MPALPFALEPRSHGGGNETTAGQKHPLFVLKPWKRSDSNDRQIYAGPNPQLFNLTVFHPDEGYRTLKWKELAPSHKRRIHVAFAHEDLSTLIHVHPEDFAKWNVLAADEETWVLEVPFNKVGKWGTLVEFDVDVAAHDDDGDHAAHGTPSNTTTPASNTTHSDGHNHSKRHGGHEMGRKTYEEASTFTVIADPSPPTDQAWPKVTLPESIPGSSGVNQFRGIMLNPAPEDELYTLPMIASDLSLDSPLTPRTTLLVNQTFLATLRTVPPVLQPNSCAIAVLEFFLASGNTWAPVTNLAPFLDAAAHLTTVNPTMTEVGHSHAVPYDPPETLGPESNLASPTSGVVTTALPDLCGSDPGHQASPPPVFGSKLVAPLRFNEAGKHAIFVQSSRLQDGGFVYVVGGVGRVMLAPRFVVEVGTGMESTTGLKAVEGVKISSPGVIPVANGPVDGMKGAEIGMSGTVPSPQASGGFAGIALVLFLLVAGTALFVWQRRRRGQTVSGFRTPNLTSPRIFENPGVYTELVDDFDEFLVDEDHHEEEEVGMSKLEHK